MAPLAMMSSSGNVSLTKRRKLTVATIAGAAALFALSSNRRQRMAFDPMRDLASTMAESGDLEVEQAARLGGSQRALANIVEGYDTDQTYDIPSWYDNYANVWDTIVPNDQPLLWYVPRTGDNTLSKLMTHCLGFVSANSVPSTEEGGTDGTELEIRTLSDGGEYVNLDMSTSEGIAKALDKRLVQNNLADVITTSAIQSASQLMMQTHRGRLFAMLRHPVKRAVDLFFYRQRATYDPTFDPEVAAMTLKEYAHSARHVPNLMVRTLAGKIDIDDVTPEDVTMCKHILRRHVVIGIAEEKFFDVSVVRFEKYFGWWEDHDVMNNMTVNHCHHDYIKRGGHFGTHVQIKKDDEEYRILASRNWADMELYMWAKGLFKRQAVLPKLFAP